MGIWILKEHKESKFHLLGFDWNDLALNLQNSVKPQRGFGDKTNDFVFVMNYNFSQSLEKYP